MFPSQAQHDSLIIVEPVVKVSQDFYLEIIYLALSDPTELLALVC